MARKWNTSERKAYRFSLSKLYTKENKTIKEIGLLLGVSEKTIYKRLQILEIPINPQLKSGYRNIRKDFNIPKCRSEELAEFFGIMLGDGKLSPFQVIVTLGNKEKSYAEHVCELFNKLFNVKPKIGIRKQGYIDVYLSSVVLSRWLQKEGLVFNKVKNQVGVPKWIIANRKYCESFLRGFFDTDGSIYKLKYGIQISFTNYSFPILESLQTMLFKLEYKPSRISSHKVYLTQRGDVSRFFKEIKPSNLKHLKRFEEFDK